MTEPSDDELRRRLEREARYSDGLANLLKCLRDGHAPLLEPGGSSPWRVNLVDGRTRVSLLLCRRCQGVYWAEQPVEVMDPEDAARERVRQARLEAEQRLRVEEAERQAWLENADRTGAGYRGSGRP